MEWPDSPPATERYVHHGTKVAVQTELKGKHRDHCLCYLCGSFISADEGLIVINEDEGRHGYLERGVWREV